ncbi:MAG: ion transporter, partial [Variibacter sp.]|nr:ion transporter [Variibacter sp.]
MSAGGPPGGSLKTADGAPRAPAPRTFRRRLFEILEHGPVGGRAGRWAERGLIGLILVNLLAVVLGSVPGVGEEHSFLLAVIEYVSVIVFVLEYAARLWVAVEHEMGASPQPFRARLAYATSLDGVIDLVAILPLLLGLFFPADLRAFLVLRIFRFLKLARYSVGVRSLLDALYEER